MESEIIETEGELEGDSETLVVDVSVEDLAREMGWKDDFDGPEKVSAEEYIRKTQAINRQASKDIGSLKHHVERLESQLKEVATNTGKQVKQAVDSARQRLLSERDEAIESADKTRVREIDREIAELESPAPPVQGPPPDIQKSYQDAIDKFTAENHWFDQNHQEFDPYLRGLAVTIGTNIANGQPDILPDDLLKQTMETLRRKEPEAFAKPTNKPTYVAGSRPRTPKGSAWDQLVAEEPEAKSVFDEYVKDGVFKDSKEEREKYAKEVLNG